MHSNCILSAILSFSSLNVVQFSDRNSDINLVELTLTGGVKEDDRAVLLEGGVLQSASSGLRNSSVASNIIRFVEK